MRGFLVLLLVLILVGTGGLAFWRCEGDAPMVKGPESIAVGRSGRQVVLQIADAGSGLRRASVRLRHAGGEATLFSEPAYPGHLLSGSVRKPSVENLTLEIEAGKLDLTEGEATLEVEAVDWSWASFFSGNVTQRSIPAVIDLTPPRVSVTTGLTYVRRAGSAAVVYNVSDDAVDHGVQVGDAFYRGFPFPGSPDPKQRFALFAVDRDARAEPQIRVVATDLADNARKAGWSTRVQERKFEDVRINLGNRFLQTKVPNLADQLRIDASDPIAAFQTINTETRAENERQIREIVANSGPERFWQGAFEQLRNSAVTSRFAEHRTYYKGDEAVSEAIHYGYDLASTAHAEVNAGNHGRVLFADDLGIYGRCVILDHGLGLTSLYAHLSRVDVAVGDDVRKGQPVGVSGTTGLAGGDHLHFAIMVGDTYVDPKEWWDAKWVRDHVEVKLAPGP